jgi:ADP-ribosylglycohydrolase
VVGNTLVVSNEAARAAGLASQATHNAPNGATGSAVVTVNARELAGKLLAKQLKGPAGLIAPLAVASLRDLTGTLAINRGGLRGHFKLSIVK